MAQMPRNRFFSLSCDEHAAGPIADAVSQAGPGYQVSAAGSVGEKYAVKSKISTGGVNGFVDNSQNGVLVCDNKSGPHDPSYGW